MKKVDIDDYCIDFVKSVTSEWSEDADKLCARIKELDQQCNAPLLMTAGIGLGDEAGEFAGIVKKLFFHNKDLDKATKEHMIKELGDVAWYFVNACRALSVLPSEVIALNVDKLQDRYPGGVFDEYFAENRKENDV